MKTKKIKQSRKNNYASQLLKTKEDIYTDGVWHGIGLTYKVFTVALNHELGLGKDRLNRVSDAANKIFKEMVDIHDAEHTVSKLDREIARIMGDKNNA